MEPLAPNLPRPTNAAPSSVPPSSPNAAAPHVPPPTVDVLVRTMRSDLTSLAASGGNSAVGQNVAVRLTAPTTGFGSAAQYAPTADASRATLTTPPQHAAIRTLVRLVLVVLGLISVGVIAALGYRYRAVIFRLSSSTDDTARTASTTTPRRVPDAVPTTPTAPVTPPTIPTLTAHRSVLAIPAEAVVTLNLPTDPALPRQLKTYTQLLREALATAPARATTIEVVARTSAGTPLAFPAFLNALNAPLIDTRVLVDSFAPDATFVVTRSGSTYAAVYIIPLKSGVTADTVRSNVASIEHAANLTLLFPQLPGTRASEGFTDSTVGTTPVRALAFTNPAGRFTYGFFKNNLVLSTSDAALTSVLLRL